jgi:ankyrin repeat protein
MLQNIPYDHQDDARRMLQALCSAVRPLTVSELTDILAIELDEKPGINPNRRRQNVDALRKSLPGFTRLEVNDETKEVRIRIAHLSVQEYLESERICQHQDVALFRVLKLDANALMARICLTLLLTPQLAAREPCYVRQQFPLAEYAARFWPQHFQNGSEKSEVENLITRLFLDSKGAFHNWLIIRNFDHPRIVQGGLDQVTTPTPFYYASKFGCVSTLTLLLHESSGHCSTGKTLPDVLNSPGGQDGTALQAASAGGYTEIVQLLLEKGADVNTYRDEFGSPLGAASCNGHAEVVQLLLRKGANVNADCSWYGTPLLAATSSGHGEVVRMLLDYDADLEAQDCEYGTPLHVASSEGYAEIVQILLNKGADVESKSLVYGKPLETAAYKGQYEIVRMLLCHLASTNAESHNYGEALQLASLGGHIDILRLLLQEGADINARDGEFGTALQAASSAGHTEVVRFLVDKGAEINATGGSIYGTALEAASNKGHIEIVKFLVDEGANINAACEFMTALQAASFRRYLEIVQLLISKEADANTKSRCFGTALQAAIMGKQAETVEWLRSTAPT